MLTRSTFAIVVASLFVGSWGCSEETPPAHAPAIDPTASATAAGGAAPTPGQRPSRGAEPADFDCVEANAAYSTAITTPIDDAKACEWDGDCELLEIESPCISGCPTAVASAAKASLEETLRRAAAEHCPQPVADGCRVQAECELSRAVCARGRCASAAPVTGPSIRERERAGRPYPPSNRPNLSSPPPRPALGAQGEARARQLFTAIQRDDPSLARDFFFPADAFDLVKGIDDPGRYWRKLVARYDADIHELHARNDLSGATFKRLELSRRGGFTGVRDEGNRLPYWASRHSQLVYEHEGVERSLEVRVLITWDDEWYITHLGEFH